MSLSTGAGFRRFRAKPEKKLSIVRFAAAIFKLRRGQDMRGSFHEVAGLDRRELGGIAGLRGARRDAGLRGRERGRHRSRFPASPRARRFVPGNKAIEPLLAAALQYTTGQEV